MKDVKEVLKKLGIYSIFGLGVLAFAIYFIFLFSKICTDVKEFKAEIAKLEDKRQEVTTDTVRLASINYSSEIKGSIRESFVIGSGYENGRIEEEQYYVAYRVLDDGGKKLYKMKADISIIYDTLEADDEAYAEVDTNGLGQLVAVRIFVPQGSIVQDYDFSLD